METVHALALLNDKTVTWPKSGSKVTKGFIALVSDHIAAHYVVYNIDSHEKEFITAVKSAIKEGLIIRTAITPDNLRQVFDKWVALIGCELGGIAESDYALLFFADIMHDGKTAMMQDFPARLLFNGKDYEPVSDRGYRNFWAIYHRPPELERHDSLLPLDERSFKGAYYTPLPVVEKVYDLLCETLGKNWQKNYIVFPIFL
jgi:hypothetical protein